MILQPGERRPPRPVDAFLHGVDEDIVIITGRHAAQLERCVNLAALREVVRGAGDPEFYNVLLAVGTAADHWIKRCRSLAGTAAGSATGSVIDRTSELDRSLSQLTTGSAAEQLGITDRAIRKAIRDGRLRATQVDGKWLIDPEDLKHYRRRPHSAA